MITLTQAVYFAALVEHGNMRVAAEKLGVSQPTISVSLLCLERILGCRMFERTEKTTPKNVRSLQLTSDGVKVCMAILDFKKAAENVMALKKPAGKI